MTDLLTNPIFIWEPTVTLLAATTLMQDGINATRGFTGGTDAERLVEFAGRTCYQSFDRGRPSPAFHENIREVGHGSLWEHATVTLRIQGVTRWLTHELIRHRIGMSPSQLSTRYVDAGNLRMVVPSRLVGPCKRGEMWAEALVETALEYHLRGLELYQQALEVVPDMMARKRAHEMARAFLPPQAETELVATFNLRALLHFLRQRGAEAAADEMRVLAKYVWDAAACQAPAILAPVTLSVETLGDVPVMVGVPRTSP